MKQEKGYLGIPGVALMYVGTIMGAGFASGREIWQFFGVFGDFAYIGVAFVGLLFIVIGVMTSRIARALGTNDMGRVIVPGGNRVLTEFVGYFMAVILFTVLITMSAAGGALFKQQFGQSRVLGGAIIIGLVIITVIGDFERVSRVFRFLMPVLVTVVVGTCLLVMASDISESNTSAYIEPSALASKWYIAAILYLSYNVLAVIPIVATASINARSDRHANIGTALGGVFLAILAFVLVSAMLKDAGFSQSMDMPILGFSKRISRPVNLIYTFVLLFAIYASATSNYYGFTTKLKDSPKKRLLIIIFAWIGFACGLVGFTNVVAYMFPIEGYLGISVLAMIFVNYFKVCVLKDRSGAENESTDICGEICEDDIITEDERTDVS